MVHKRVGTPSESAAPHRRVDVETLSRTFVTVNKLLRYTKLIIRIITITYTIYLNYVGTNVVSSLVVTPASPLSSHPLQRTLAIATAATSLFS